MIQDLSQTIESLVMDIQEGKLLLPELQRSYVWKASQVRDLFDSLYHGYPSGQLLVWETDDLPSGNRKVSLAGATTAQRSPRLLLDGQQRLTSLAAVMLGRPLRVRDVPRSIDIAFNVFTEKFEVAGPRHSIQHNWISLRKFFTEGATSIFFELGLDPRTPEAKLAHERLNRLEHIKRYPYHVNLLVHLNYAEVTRIFVRTNSGGTTLGYADLALAQISSYWHGVTEKFEQYQQEFKPRSWGLRLDNGLLLRLVVVLLTGQSHFSRLFRAQQQPITVEEMEIVWERARRALDRAVAFLVHDCLIDHLEMLPTRNILIPLVAFFDRYGSNLTDRQARELQRWVYMALIWTRYSTSSETAMDQDIAALAKEQPIQSMIQNIENEVGRRPVTEQELQDQRKNSPYMVMAYVLARLAKARDWFNGITIGNDLGQQDVYLHHIFPKPLLSQRYDLRKESRIVDQVANMVFLAAPVSRSAANRSPALYLPEIEEQRLRAQYIPLERDLWEPERFEQFVRERRKMLAQAINQLLSSLGEEQQLWVSSSAAILEIRVDALERGLRRVVATRLREVHGDNAWEYLVPADIRNTVKSRIKKEEESHPFTAGQHETLEARLAFCLFSDLFKIIQANWTQFKDIFGSQQDLETYQRFVVNARNKLKHGNEIEEVDLASAEAALLWLEKCLEKLELEEDESEEEVLVGAALKGAEGAAPGPLMR